MSNTIKIHGVTKSFFCRNHVIPVLKDINIEINTGEIIIIKGAKGTGKDTLLNILGLLDKPTTGEFLWNNQEISQLSDKELKSKRNREVGLILKEINLIDKMTIRDNIMLPTYLIEEITEEKREVITKECLKLVGLLDLESKYVSELNEIEKLKVLIARGIVNNPLVVIVDDIFESIANNDKECILSILRKLTEEGKNIILVTNNLDNINEKTYNYEDGIIDSVLMELSRK